MKIETIYLKAKPRDYHGDGLLIALKLETFIMSAIAIYFFIEFYLNKSPVNNTFVTIVDFGILATIINIILFLVVYPLYMKHKEIKK